MNGRDYLDANPLEKAPDGELKCRRRPQLRLINHIH